MKPIRFSPHAEGNLVAREITRADAEAAIRKPDHRESSRPPRVIVNRVYSDTVTGETMLLRVVIEEMESEMILRGS